VRQSINARPLLIQENINLSNNDSALINLSSDQAVYLYGLNSATDTSGNVISLADSNVLDLKTDYNILLANSNLTINFSGIKNVALNSVAGTITLSSNGYLVRQIESDIDIVTFSDSWNIQAEDHLLDIDLRENLSSQFLTNLNGKIVSQLLLRRWNVAELLQLGHTFADTTLTQIPVSNFEKISFYSPTDSGFLSDGNFDQGYQLSISNSNSDFEINSQPFSFSDSGMIKFEYDVADNGDLITLPVLNEAAITYADSSLFWAATAQVVFQDDDAALRVISARTEGLNGALIPVEPVQDSWKNGVKQMMPFTLDCDGVEINQGNLQDLFDPLGQIYLVESSRDCTLLSFKVSYDNWLDGNLYQSTAESNLDNSRGESPLSLERVQITSNALPTTQVTGDSGKLLIQLADSNVSSLSNYKIEWQLDNGDWNELSAVESQNIITADFELPTKLPKVASIRIQLDNNLGSSFINTLNGAFNYGTTDLNQLDSDDDNVVDANDAFPLDPNESVDTDNDGIGNNADLDDDNDGIPDTFENLNGLNPLDASDAQKDNDNDGLSNLEEYLAGRDPNVAEKKGGGSFAWQWLAMMILFRKKLIQSRHK